MLLSHRREMGVLASCPKGIEGREWDHGLYGALLSSNFVGRREALQESFAGGVREEDQLSTVRGKYTWELVTIAAEKVN